MKFQNKNISYFAKTNFREEGHLFGIWQKDRSLHKYIIGKTGAGKTNLLITLILQDIVHSRAVCVFDVHGDLITELFKYIPFYRKKDVLFLDIPNENMEYLYNPLKRVPYEKRSLVASGVLTTFKNLWKGAWGLKLEHILRYILLTLLDQEKSNFSDIPKIIHDASFREACIKNVLSKEVRNFWLNEFEKYSVKADLVPILNKVGAFLAHPSVRRFLVDNRKEISLRYAMDNHKIIIVNLSKGSLGADSAHILASLLLHSIMNASFSRIDTAEDERKPFHLFLDEFQNYTHSLSEMLSELRKFKVTLTLAHQYLHQLDTDVRNAVLGNVGSIISFRLGQSDANYMAKEFYPVFESSDFTNLENYDIYLKLMINGKPSKPFSATTIPFKDIIKFRY